MYILLFLKQISVLGLDKILFFYVREIWLYFVACF
jgi:hypothetical protein